jgi:hypothetical protein
VSLRLDSSLALRPNQVAAERGAADVSRAASAAFTRALDGVTHTGQPGLVRHVAPTRTPLSGSQAADALQAAWQDTVGRPASPSTLSILVGQWAHETGRGSAMLNYNFGGIKGAAPGGTSTAYLTHEGSGASAVQVRDRFRAYDTPEAGASDYLSLLARRYPEALQAAERGDPAGFVQALKSRGYFTGDEAAYTKSVAALAQRALASGFDALGAARAATPALGATPALAAPELALSASVLEGGPLQDGAALAAAGLPQLPPGAYATAFADEVGRVELLMSALRIGELGEKDS